MRLPLRHFLGILIHPKTEWQRIAAEPLTLPMLYLGYIAPLSAIEFVALKVRLIYEVDRNPGIEPLLPYFNWGFTLPGMISKYVWGLVAVYLLSLLANVLTPLFSAEKNFVQAFKVVAFSLTSIWVGGFFIAVPFFSLDKSITILSTLYSLYLLYGGLIVVINATPPRSIVYAIVLSAAYGTLVYVGRAALPIVVNFPHQWPVLDPGVKTTILVLLIVTAILVAVFLVCRRPSQSSDTDRKAPDYVS